MLSELITSHTPTAAIARLGLRMEDEQVLQTELARYRDIEMPLRERTERLARAYASSPRDEDQQSRLDLEAERAALRSDTHARIIQRLSEDGRRKWLVRIGEARKLAMAFPSLDGRAANPAQQMTRRAASSTVTGRLRHVACGIPLVLEVDTGTTRLRLVVEDAATVSVLGQSSGTTTLPCGGQDVPIRIGYDPAPGASDGTAGVVRVLDYRGGAPQ